MTRGPSKDEILIGFQVINKANLGNTCTRHAAAHLCGRDAKGKELSGVSMIKKLTKSTDEIIALEVETRLEKFIDKFNDNRAVGKGLDYFRVGRSNVDRDVEEVKTHKRSVSFATHVLNDPKGLKANGELLSLYEEEVGLQVDAEVHLEPDHRLLIAYQDLLNAISLELRGLCSYNGTLRYPSFAGRRDLVLSRFRVADSMVDGTEVLSIREAREFHAEHERVQDALRDVETAGDLTSLGLYLSSKVPMLPLLRRWWNFS